MTKLATHAYIGINAEGKMRAIVFDDPAYKKDTAKRVAEWIKMGRTVERLPAQEACDRMRADGPAKSEGRAQ
jgi:hypothetical protein